MSHRRWLVTVCASLAAHGVALLLLLFAFPGVVLPPALVVDLTEGVRAGEDRDGGTSGRPAESPPGPGGGAASAGIRHHRLREIAARLWSAAPTSPSSSHPSPEAPDTDSPPQAPRFSHEPSRLSGLPVDAQERSQPPFRSEESASRPTPEAGLPPVPAGHDEGPAPSAGGSAASADHRQSDAVEPGAGSNSGPGDKGLGGTGPGKSGAGDRGLALGTPGTGAGPAPQHGPYFARLRRLIQEGLRYPLAARRRGLTGTVHVEVTILPNGVIGSVSLLRSSSHQILDEAALDAVRSLPLLPFPVGLDARSLTVRLPVVFELQ